MNVPFPKENMNETSAIEKYEVPLKRYLFTIYVFKKYDQMGNFDESTMVSVSHTDRVKAEEEALKLVNDPNRQMVHTKQISEIKEE